jgi:hypothetical protein
MARRLTALADCPLYAKAAFPDRIFSGPAGGWNPVTPGLVPGELHLCLRPTKPTDLFLQRSDFFSTEMAKTARLAKEGSPCRQKNSILSAI